MPEMRNYQKELDKITGILEQTGERKTLCLHSCCGPCSSYVMEYLSKYFDITVFYYNPNIEPEEEYLFRLEEQKRLVREMPDLRVSEIIAGEYEPEEFHRRAAGLEDEPEGGKRCTECFLMRLEKTAALAKARGFDYFTTTLSVSPYKNAAVLNACGEEVAKRYGVPFLNSDFKKRNGYQRTIELSKQYDLYRQDFCGCVYSRAEGIAESE